MGQVINFAEKLKEKRKKDSERMNSECISFITQMSDSWTQDYFGNRKEDK